MHSGLTPITSHFCGNPGARISDFYPSLRQFDPYILDGGPRDADFLFCTHRPKSIREMLTIPDRGQVRILLCKEAMVPDYNLFDYAVSFDATLLGNRVFRPHTLLTFERDLEYGDLNVGQKTSASSFRLRQFFCDYIYGNSRAHPVRGQIFDALNSRFEGVRSYGSHKRNVRKRRYDLSALDKLTDWRSEKIKLQGRHRFSVAAENATFPGYTSEKLLTSLMAGSIPIYWGNPEVHQEFNVRRFLVFDGHDYEGLASRIQDLENSNGKLEQILSEPALTRDQEELLDANRKDFITWFGQFFAASPTALSVRARGWFPDWYTGMLAAGYRRQQYSLSRFQAVARTLLSDSRS